MSDFNTLLYRPVQSGAEFENLIPKSSCKVHFTGNGDTGYSVKQMAAMIGTFKGQLAKVARKLKKSSLYDTCAAFHRFAYNHFQYRADKATQYLRSPACAWSVRKKGIDCKTYSIIAGCLLANQAINFYIRRIKQGGFMPELWTHVYIIVPKDQQGGNLAKGYYVIDGTVPTMNEPEFTEKDDFYMEHVGLAGAYPQHGLNGLNLQELNKVKFADLKGIFKGLDCIGGTAYDQNEFEANVNIMIGYFQKRVEIINSSVASNNMAGLSAAIADFLGTAGLIKASYMAKKAEGWNSCTTGRLDLSISAADFFFTTCGQALQQWANQYFNVAPAGTRAYVNSKIGSESIEKTMGLDFTYVGTGVTFNQPVYTYTPKGINIPAFEITDYVVQSAKSGGFNFGQFVQSLGQVAAVYGAVAGNGGSAAGGEYIADSEYYNTQKTQAAGFGIVGWALVLVMAGMAAKHFANMPDKPKKATTTTK